MILLIDNYDSFTYNLYQLIAIATKEEINVIRNDAIDMAGISRLNPSKIILSPGPGRPEDAGICIQTVRELGKKIPILGICLGHQAIAVAYGGIVDYAVTPLHGKSRLIAHQNGTLFKNIESPFAAGRYHSLIVKSKNLPKELVIDAYDVDGEIMALSHTQYKTYGVQFHPESILTLNGDKIIKNFLELSNAKGTH